LGRDRRIIKTGIDFEAALANARAQLEKEKNISPAFRSALELLFTICQILMARFIKKNSRNSDTPPAMDPNRTKKSNAEKKRNPGGQPGHEGKTLQPVEHPDEVKKLTVDREKLPPGQWKEAGYERRQVFDMKVKLYVTEYQAERLVNEKGEYISAEFPEGLVQTAQYGASVKAHGVYMSVEQAVPAERISEHFGNQIGIPVSTGSICNFKKEAHKLLKYFEIWVISRLIDARVLNFDETGINIAAQREWVHSISTDLLTYYFPHTRRGSEAMDQMGVIAETDAVLVHDHWKAYYRYSDKTHALCNAHHVRELTAAQEEGQKWAEPMIKFLYALNKKVKDSGGMLSDMGQKDARKEYRKILGEAETECPRPPPNPPGKRGRVAKSKSRNLIERLIAFEDDTLRFMTDKDVPFNNNQAERDLRMIKVQQKVSGCFRSWDGAYYFCRIKSYLSTCKKHSISPSDALNMLFNGENPHFMLENH
jgi:transposase